MKKFISMCINIILAMLFSQQSIAQANYKNNLNIIAIQATGPSIDVRYEGTFWVEIANPDWGELDCPADWHAVNASAHPHVVSLLITAYSLGRNVRIDVDDTQKIGDYCEISKVRISD